MRLAVLGLACSLVGCKDHGGPARHDDDAAVRPPAVPMTTTVLDGNRMRQPDVRYLAFHDRELVALSWDGTIGSSQPDPRDAARRQLQIWDPARRATLRGADTLDGRDAGEGDVGGFAYQRADAGTLIDACVDGDRVAVVDLGGHVSVRALDTFAPRWTATIAGAHAVALAGGLVAVGADDGALTLLDADDGRVRWTEPVGAGAITVVAVSPDGRLVISASTREAVVRDADTRAVVATLAHASPGGDTPDDVEAIAIAPDGRTVATAAWDGVVRLWDLPSGAPRTGLPVAGEQFALAWSADGAWLGAAGRRYANTWRATGGAPVATFEAGPGGFGSYVSAIAFAPEGDAVATGAQDGDTIRMWSRTTGAELLGSGHGDEVRAVGGADGTRLVSAGDRDVIVWDLAAGRATGGFTLPVDDYHGSFAISPDGSVVAQGQADRLVLYAPTDGAVVRSIATKAYPTHPTFSPDGRRLAVTIGAEARCYDVATGAVVRTITAPADVDDVGFAGDAIWYLVGNALTVAGLADAAERAHVVIGTPYPFAVDVDPDGWFAVFTLISSGVAVWDLQRGAPLWTREDLRNPVFAPDGSLVAAATEAGAIELLDPGTGQVRATLDGHPDGGVTSLAFTPKRRVISGGGDGRVVVWARFSSAGATVPGP